MTEFDAAEEIGAITEDREPMYVEYKDSENEEHFKKQDKQWDKLFNPKEKSPKENHKKKISIKKYSGNGRLPLRESVVIGELSKFVSLDKNKNPQYDDSIETVNEILIPGDTIDSQNPLPYIFDSEEDLTEHLEEAKNESLDSIFSKVESIYRRYVDVEDHYYTLFTGDTIWTQFQDKFGYTHYNILIGDNGSGKNSALLVFKYLGYRVFYVVSASAANYYTAMGNKEEGQITIAEDEAGDIAEDKDKRNVFKTGYCSGGCIPKVETDGGRKQDNWLTYCQKWVAMEELPDNKEIKGILDRSLVSKFVTGDVSYNIKDVIRSAGDPKFKPLYDEIIHVRKLLFCYRLLHHDDPILDVQLNVKNRSAELTKPLIRLFQNSPVALKRILDCLSKFMIDRNEVKKSTFESKLYEAICSLFQERNNRFYAQSPTLEDTTLDASTLTNKAIRDKFKEIMDGNEIDGKPGLFYCSDFGTVSQNRITRTLKSKFKASSTKPDVNSKSTRCLSFEQASLDKISSYYSIPDKIEIINIDSIGNLDSSTPSTDIRHILENGTDIELTYRDDISTNKQKNDSKNIAHDTKTGNDSEPTNDSMCRNEP